MVVGRMPVVAGESHAAARAGQVRIRTTTTPRYLYGSDPWPPMPPPGSMETAGSTAVRSHNRWEETMTQGSPAVVEYTGVTQAALTLGNRACSGAVASTGRQTCGVDEYASVSAAALALGHRTYSGTVASTERQP